LELTAIFLDRDGVINRKAPAGEYVRSWQEFEFLPGALEGLVLLGKLGLPLVVVTNQRGVALGRMSEADVRAIHAEMTSAVREAGARLDKVLHCPHEAGTCDCRKPATGMLEEAARALASIDLRRSALIGDSDSDVEAARRVGAFAIAVGAGAGADLVVPDLLTAARRLTEVAA
jgi:D-glycero-D-manno-heptose 1,7-bisphosphate phosphatase